MERLLCVCESVRHVVFQYSTWIVPVDHFVVVVHIRKCVCCYCTFSFNGVAIVSIIISQVKLLCMCVEGEGVLLFDMEIVSRISFED